MTGRIDRNTKKELEKAVKKAKLKGEIPESAQDTIPYKVPYPDGIFESDDGYFTQTIAFEDITYQLLDNDPKNILFEWWCKLINYFEPETWRLTGTSIPRILKSHLRKIRLILYEKNILTC